MIKLLSENLGTSNLPSLIGSDKQVRWAEDIRKDWTGTAERSLGNSFWNLLKYYTPEKLEKPTAAKRWADKIDDLRRQYLATEALLSVADNAGWWIYHRDDHILTCKGEYMAGDADMIEEGSLESLIKKAVEQATGITGSTGNGIYMNCYPGCEKYIIPAQNFVGWLLQSNTASQDVRCQPLPGLAW